MDCRERGSRARGVYPTQDTSHLRTERAKEGRKEGRNVVTKGKNPKEDLTIDDIPNKA